MQASEINPGERAKDVNFTDDTLSVDLVDGRTIVVPLVRYPRLLEATLEKRQNWRESAAGYRIHWPDIDEDLSTAGLLRGAPADLPFLQHRVVPAGTPSAPASAWVGWIFVP